MNKKRKALSCLLWASVFALVLVFASWIAPKSAEAACSHSYRWVVKKQPNCKESGYQNYECSKCRHVKNSMTLAPVPNHSWNRSSASCTVAKKCTRCGTVGQNATGHTYDRVTSTCTAPKKCVNSGCGYIVENAKGHSYTWVIKKQPTCASTGYRNEECSRCHHVRNSATLEKVPNHTWDRGVATCTQAKKCTRCGTVGQYALGHKWNRDSATCTEAKMCTRTGCGTVAENKKPHTYSWVIIQQPTCTKTGYRNYSCSCGHTINSATIDKVPHVYTRNVIYKEASEAYKRGGTSKNFYNNLTNVKLTGNMRVDLLAVATSQANYTEGNNEAGFSGTTNGSDNYTEYSRWLLDLDGYHYIDRLTDSWCAAFVAWCARRANIPTSAIINNGRAAEITACIDTYTMDDVKAEKSPRDPQPGDLVHFKFTSNHVGIVKEFTRNNDGSCTLITIEGNTSPDTTGSQENGDGVYVKDRTPDLDNIVKFASWTDEEYNSDAMTYKGICTVCGSK